MKPYSRLRESLKSGIYILIGIVAIYFISINLKALNIENQESLVSKDIEEEVTIKSEAENQLNIDALYEYIYLEANEENIMHLLKSYVPGGFYLNKVSIKQNDSMQSIMLTYIIEQDLSGISKNKKLQVALLDSAILMSLYPNIDAVKVNIIVEADVYSDVVYRPDLEDYFGVGIEANEEKNTFERIANEFIDLSCVSQYATMKHPYDSSLGKEVEEFYKMNFPILEENEPFIYIDEALEKELVEKYGYKLFLQGLIYKNPLMNYYSAYRLVEYYGSVYSEEIILELATCAMKSQDERVKNVCQKVIDLLIPLKEGVRIFDRFTEDSLEGGRKLYIITEKGLSTFAKWQGEEEAKLKVVSISPTKEYVLCEATTSHNKYRYILSCKEDKGYSLDEESFLKNGVTTIRELNKQVNDILAQYKMTSAVTSDQIKWEWYLENLMSIKIGEDIELIYNIETDEIQLKLQYIESLDLE